MNNTFPLIRRAQPEDLDTLKQVGKTTFIESFAHVNTKEDMELYLAESFTDALLMAELRDQDIRYFLLYVDGNIAGYLKLNSGAAQKEMKNKNALEIERIYLLKDFQNRSLGQLLFETALEIAQEEKMNWIWLGVWEKNTSAIRFYKRNHFVEFDQHVFKLGSDLQTDLLMKREIKII